LTVDAAPSPSGVESAAAPDRSVRFSLGRGSDPAALDGTSVSAVVVTVTAMPRGDGASLAAERARRSARPPRA